MEQRAPGYGSGSNGRRVGARVVTATLSAVILLATGFGWHFYSALSGGISTSDVISGGLGSAPPGSDVNILLVGVDSRTDAKGHPLSRKVLAELRSGAEDGVLNSDTIILLHVPAGGGRATAISIPRDSYVDIAGNGKNKINYAYPSATLAAADDLRKEHADPTTVELESRKAGRSALIKTVEQLTGAKIDHYAEVNLLGFYNLTNAIGGVRVCLKNAVNEYRSGARFPAGEQTISGGAALAFVRQRYELPQSDFSRIRRQQVFLAGVAHKILSAGTLTNPARLTDLVQAAQEAVVLDTGWDVLSFARQASNIAGGNIEFVTIPTTGGRNTTHGDVVTVDPDQVREFVASKTGGAPATAAPDSPGSSDSSDADAVPPSSLEVNVRNGTSQAGLASKVSEKLAGLGYQQGTTDNSDEESSSTSVHYPPGHSDAGEQVAKLIGNVDTEQDSALADGSVRIDLGSDFSMSDVHTRSGTKATSPPPPPAPPITAGGVPCVD